jgi:hypothetical protein
VERQSQRNSVETSTRLIYLPSLPPQIVKLGEKTLEIRRVSIWQYLVMSSLSTVFWEEAVAVAKVRRISGFISYHDTRMASR